MLIPDRCHYFTTHLYSSRKDLFAFAGHRLTLIRYMSVKQYILSQYLSTPFHVRIASLVVISN